ncbi:hypothetical protein phiAS5_ORF0303 [Aeromonas phage phiAS5]|uniref:Uncharacterized protein n=1 Tax=Aeromonas phage phiAS5 TaxID=879630 RepID=E1A257_9CAUD|nr:hypothetical protein phiAS5_ORF0303 [Aeromonas phage phiAS5]ADM80146.1 hypothetical protein phiAS5_ORF0303 [Aeromonas phage phiAS5]BES53092.1 hypothetical protein [Aeromonas phage phiWae14]
MFYVVIRSFFDVEYGGEYKEFYAVRTNKKIAESVAARANAEYTEKGFSESYSFSVEEHTEESFCELEGGAN